MAHSVGIVAMGLQCLALASCSVGPAPPRELELLAERASATRAHATSVPAAAVPAPAAAEAPRDWNFTIAPYGWLPNLTGTVVSDGTGTDIEIPSGDFLSATRFGFMLYAEARWKRLFAAFDGTWATLQAEETGQIANIDVEVKQQLYDVRLGYGIIQRTRGEPVPADSSFEQPQIVLDGYLGARYWRTDIEANVSGLINERASGVSTRWDPFIGARLRYDFSPRWTSYVLGDVGGFGIGEAAEFAWQAQVAFGFRIARWVTVLAGYRALAADTVTGSGTNRNGADLIKHGPMIGAGFIF